MNVTELVERSTEPLYTISKIWKPSVGFGRPERASFVVEKRRRIL